MANKIYTRDETEEELRKMNVTEATAYYHICLMNTKMIQSDADREHNQMHLDIMTEILYGAK
jgi:hypothetical protein